MSEANKELVRRHIEEILNAERLETCDEILAEEYVEHAVAPFGRAAPGRVHGPSAGRETSQWLKAQFPDLHMTIEFMIAQGDMVAVLVRSEGTNRGPIGGFAPPTNKHFVADQSHWYRIEAGKLCEHWATRDDLSAMLQLGVINPPGPPRDS